MLTNLFADLRQSPQKEPVIIIPGALGSILEDTTTGRVAWGRRSGRGLEALALPIDRETLRDNRDSVVAVNVLRRMAVIPGLIEFKANEDLIRVLQEAGGYDKGDLEHPRPGDNCFLFWYDWRRDFVEAAQQLGAMIERLARELGDPDLKVHLIAQSAGGLVARYYVKYGTADVLDQEPLPPPTYAGTQHVAQVIMLGTPNNGSLETFQLLHQGFRVPNMGRFTPAMVFTMPAAYQLLPHEEETVFLDGSGRPLEVSLYDPANWETYGWSVFSPEHLTTSQQQLAQQRRFLSLALRRARRFHRALDQGNPADDPVEYVLLGSDCRSTLRRVELTQDGAVWRTRFQSEDRQLSAKLFGLGDGSVTKESLLGSHRTGISQDDLAFSALHVASAVFVCESHLQLTQNLTALDNLLHALLVQEATAQHQAICLYCQRRFGALNAKPASAYREGTGTSSQRSYREGS
jgi:pimeloyl-ACP methyl ester carboxylesterase